MRDGVQTVTEAWSDERLITVRMANQGLKARSDPNPRATALRTVGVQAQDVPAAHLAMRSCCADLDLAGSVTLTEQPASVVRTWLMRGTLHAVATDDVRWLTELLGPALLISRARVAFAEIDSELERINLIGYRDRSPFLPVGAKHKIMVGGWICPSVVLDGQIVGSRRALVNRWPCGWRS
ncbi:MAG: prevent-host-death protein [Pseudonocardiales bacterium]|nr:prevent-host-death protein [Pseudonocardiales bacterium]